MSGSAGWLWVRCLMDQRLHLLDRQSVLDIAEIGCALARCGVLLLIPEVALHPAGEPCPACLGGLLPSNADETELAGNDGGPHPRVTPLMCRSQQVAGGDAHAVGRDDDVRVAPVPTVAAVFLAHLCGALVCPACAGADDGGPISGWPLVELPQPHLAPGGQPVPPPARHCPVGPVQVPPPRFSHPGRHCGAGSPAVLPGGASGPQCEPEVTRPRWGSCPADGQLHLLDPTAVREATVVGWAKAHCGRLIFAANFTLRGESRGLCVSCVAAGSTP